MTAFWWNLWLTWQKIIYLIWKNSSQKYFTLFLITLKKGLALMKLIIKWLISKNKKHAYKSIQIIWYMKLSIPIWTHLLNNSQPKFINKITLTYPMDSKISQSFSLTFNQFQNWIKSHRKLFLSYFSMFQH